MDYFLVHNDQNNAYLTIGTDNGFGVFWADQGLRALMNIVDKEPEKLTKVQIKTDQNHTLNVSEFLEKIDKLKVIIK